MSNETGDVVEFSQGDSGALWIREIYDKGKVAVGIEKYEPGYSKRVYDVVILSSKDDSGEPDDSVRVYGKVEVEVLVQDEF